MVSLTTVANPVAARILAAHLGAEGIVWELRGNVDGPYPLGPVEVLVAADDLAVARQVVVEQEIAEDEAVEDDYGEVEDALAGAAAGAAGATAHRRTNRRTGRRMWLPVALLLITLALVLGRLLTLAQTH
jgi:Putative prokaryotic signal transducing protein